MKSLITVALFTLVGLGSIDALASDLAKEKRWADQIVDAILDGDAEYLNDGMSEFLTIYTEAEDESDRGVILMHGTGIHPDWQQVIQPLRVELTTAGWHTLSIQMPILHNEAEYQEYVPLYPGIAPRIDAAIRFLKDQGIKQIVLIGHSQGATMGAYYLRDNPGAVSGFIPISAFHVDNGGPQDVLSSYSKLKLPMLDIYGGEDNPEIIEVAGKRKAAAGKASVTQVKIDGANHFFDGKDGELVEAVQQWLDSL